jgi:putative YhdH/YhfP family quinone oxidoreductase
MPPAERFDALIADHAEDGRPPAVGQLALDDLPEGDALVEVAYSSVNYKDALAARHDGQVARISPIVPGIDFAGTLVEAAGDALSPGTPVLAHGYEIGVARHGGFARYARVPAEWIVPLPEGLSAREAMTIGTAGFTAALSVVALADHGVAPDDGPVLVTGATGGVGSTAVSILSRLGYEVHAATGKADAADWLRELGASEIVARDELAAESKRPLDKQRWAGAVDSVGGSTLAGVLRSLRYGGAVAASGLTGGPGLATTVLPFILRSVALLGIDSVEVPIERRREIWGRLAGDLRPDVERLVGDELPLDRVPEALERIRAGGMRGRTLVALG